MARRALQVQWYFSMWAGDGGWLRCGAAEPLFARWDCEDYGRVGGHFKGGGGDRRKVKGDPGS